MELAHNWTQAGHELAGQFGTIPFQHYHCRACKVQVRLPDVASETPPVYGCTGYKKEVIVKVPWKSPMREKSNARDYPAKKKTK